MPKLSKKRKKTTKKSVSSHRPVVVAVSGFFNPLHVGHLDMINKAKKLGDQLVVIINNDKQVKLKNRVPFMPEADRMKIVAALRGVDKVVLAVDDYRWPNGEIPCIKTLAKVHPDIFANGGDRHNVNDVPEYDICQKLHIKMVDGLGKKIRASSELIANAKKYEAELRAAQLKSVPLPVKSVSAKPTRHSCGCCQ
jgi:cytidyltransferase-like protein